MSDLKRSAKEMKTYAIILAVISAMISHAVGSENKGTSRDIDLLSPSSNEVWTNRLLRIPGMNPEEIEKMRKQHAERYSSWLSYAIALETGKSSSPDTK
jgi:hypothetical protein